MSRYTKISLFLFIFLSLACSKRIEAKTFNFENKTYEFNPATAGTAADLGVRAPNLESIVKQTLLNLEPPRTSLLDSQTLGEVESLSSQINQSARSAKLIWNGEKVLEFDPGQNGQILDVFALYRSLTDLSADDEQLPVLIAFPPVRLSETNDLGINELVAEGESDFSGSPKNRIHNIKVGSAKFNGIMFKPGEEFSFNKFLGDVDEQNGFLPELVIKKIGLVPEFGGGLCQVSSTTFRAAMNAGLPITERRNHSFAVRYYAPQGTDATIYPGATDFKFTNDLASHLLIATRIDGNKLYFDFYGTKDERSVTFDGPYQYDKKEDGSMKAVWTRTVAYPGEEKKQTFRSTYLPPALFPKISTVESNIPNPTSNQNVNETPPDQTTQ
ncbi:MAG: VanW family protein [Candidatus Doudnabacteria bacterium]|nr:VanW family protein [Candidatus Doudnabacteria bacterium]